MPSQIRTIYLIFNSLIEQPLLPQVKSKNTYEYDAKISSELCLQNAHDMNLCRVDLIIVELTQTISIFARKRK